MGGLRVMEAQILDQQQTVAFKNKRRYLGQKGQRPKGDLMKCIICSAEINESLEIPPIEGPSGRMIEDLTGKLKLARELEKWTCASITAQILGGCMTIRSGHLCPSHKVVDLTFALGSQTLVPKPEVVTAPAAPASAKSDAKGK